MKKWWIGLLLAAVALVMIPATALAVKHEGEIITHFCSTCGADRECKLLREITDLRGDITDTQHKIVYLCLTCQTASRPISEDHYGGSPTCSQAAECAGCGESYTLAHTWVAANCTAPKTCSGCGKTEGEEDPNNHNLGEWNYADAGMHSRRCSRCNFEESTSHSGGKATCVDKAVCTDCHEAYGGLDADKHEHTRTTYANATGEQHRVTVVCEDCKQTVSNMYEDHNWGDWTVDGTTHTRKCQSPGCGAVDKGRHTSEPGATCVSAQTCAICNLQYLDPGKHEGRCVTTYAIDPVDAHQHIATQTCAGCQAVLSTVSEGHTKDEDANCMHATHCSVCDGYYGNTLSHRMGAWQPADDGQRHYRTCEYGCGETVYAAHDVTRTATCMEQACCRDCGVFGEVDADAHDWTEWKLWDDDQHWRYCRHNASGHREFADHTGGTATCEARAMCDVCDEYYGQGLGHDYVEHEGKEPTCTEGGWYEYVTCSRCDYSGYVEKPALGHDLVLHNPKAATCTEGGWDVYETCSRCDYSTYADIAALGHDLVTHEGKAATCTEGGWAAYETCSRCDHYVYVPTAALGHDYVAKATKPGCKTKGYTTHTCTRCQDSYRDEIVSALGHVYGEWTPNADGTNSATCLRDAHEQTVDCARFGFALAAEVRTEFDICPVCGEVSGIRLIDENGEVVEALEDVRLLLAEDAVAEALTERLPAGELVLRMGALPGGELLMSAAFEWGGVPTQPTGQVRITLPAELLEGYELRLVAEDGAEAALPVEVDAEAETVSFVLDFTDSDTPVQLMHVVPVE